MYEENVVLKEEVNPQTEVKDFRSPVKVFRSRCINVSVWKNKNKNGEEFLSFDIKKSWKDEQGKWHNVQSFNRDDLPVIAFLLAQSFGFEND